MAPGGLGEGSLYDKLKNPASATPQRLMTGQMPVGLGTSRLESSLGGRLEPEVGESRASGSSFRA